MILVNPAIINGLAHLDVMVIKVLLFLDQVFFVLFDSVLLFDILTVNGWVNASLVLGFLHYSLSNFVFCQVFVVLVFEVHFENCIDQEVDVRPLVGNQFGGDEDLVDVDFKGAEIGEVLKGACAFVQEGVIAFEHVTGDKVFRRYHGMNKDLIG